MRARAPASFRRKPESSARWLRRPRAPRTCPRDRRAAPVTVAGTEPWVPAFAGMTPVLEHAFICENPITLSGLNRKTTHLSPHLPLRAYCIQLTARAESTTNDVAEPGRRGRRSSPGTRVGRMGSPCRSLAFRNPAAPRRSRLILSSIEAYAPRGTAYPSTRRPIAPTGAAARPHGQSASPLLTLARLQNRSKNA